MPLQFTAGDRKGRPYAYISTDPEKYKFAMECRGVMGKNVQATAGISLDRKKNLWYTIVK